MPTSHSLSVNRLNQKGVIHLLLPLILLAGIIGGVYLVTSGNPLKLFSKASLGTNISFVDQGGNPITTISSATVNVKVTSPDWPQPTPTSTPTSTPSPTPTPTPTPSAKLPPCGNYGDVNLDGVVTNADANLVRQIVNGQVTPTAEQKNRGDVDGNGRITSVDVLYIRRYVSGLDKTFPVCTKKPKPTKKPGVLGESTSSAVVTQSVVLAEDPGFTVNKQTVNFTTNSFTYTFSSANPGTKTLYAKFIASDGQEQNASPFPITITLQTPSPTPTSSPTPSATPTPSPTPASGGAFSFTLSNSQTALTCSKTDANCKYTSSLIARNKLDKPVFNTTVYKTDPSNILEGYNQSIVSSGAIYPGQVALNSIVNVKAPSTLNTGLHYATLYLDGQVCNMNTNPPNSCTFFGASSLDFKVTVSDTTIKYELTNKSP